MLWLPRSSNPRCQRVSEFTRWERRGQAKIIQNTKVRGNMELAGSPSGYMGIWWVISANLHPQDCFHWENVRGWQDAQWFRACPPQAEDRGWFPAPMLGSSQLPVINLTPEEHTHTPTRTRANTHTYNQTLKEERTWKYNGYRKEITLAVTMFTRHVNTS